MHELPTRMFVTATALALSAASLAHGLQPILVQDQSPLAPQPGPLSDESSQPMPTGPGGIVQGEVEIEQGDAVEASRATVVSAVGTVQWRPSENAAWANVSQGQVLEEGAQIRTGVRSRLRVTVNGQQITFSRMGSFTFNQMLRVTKASGQTIDATRMTVDYGTLGASIDRVDADNDLKIQTPDATLAVTGTDLLLSVSSTGTSSRGLQNNTGSFRLTSPGGKTDAVTGNLETDIDADGSLLTTGENEKTESRVFTLDQNAIESQDAEKAIARSPGGGDNSPGDLAQRDAGQFSTGIGGDDGLTEEELEMLGGGSLVDVINPPMMDDDDDEQDDDDMGMDDSDDDEGESPIGPLVPALGFIGIEGSNFMNVADEFGSVFDFSPASNINDIDLFADIELFDPSDIPSGSPAFGGLTTMPGMNGSFDVISSIYVYDGEGYANYLFASHLMAPSENMPLSDVPSVVGDPFFLGSVYTGSYPITGLGFSGDLLAIVPGGGSVGSKLYRVDSPFQEPELSMLIQFPGSTHSPEFRALASYQQENSVFIVGESFIPGQLGPMVFQYRQDDHYLANGWGGFSSSFRPEGAGYLEGLNALVMIGVNSFGSEQAVLVDTRFPDTSSQFVIAGDVFPGEIDSRGLSGLPVDLSPTSPPMIADLDFDSLPVSSVDMTLPESFASLAFHPRFATSEATVLRDVLVEYNIDRRVSEGLPPSNIDQCRVAVLGNALVQNGEALTVFANMRSGVGAASQAVREAVLSEMDCDTDD